MIELKFADNKLEMWFAGGPRAYLTPGAAAKLANQLINPPTDAWYVVSQDGYQVAIKANLIVFGEQYLPDGLSFVERYEFVYVWRPPLPERFDLVSRLLVWSAEQLGLTA